MLSSTLLLWTVSTVENFCRHWCHFRSKESSPSRQLHCACAWTTTAFDSCQTRSTYGGCDQFGPCLAQIYSRILVDALYPISNHVSSEFGLNKARDITPWQRSKTILVHDKRRTTTHNATHTALFRLANRERRETLPPPPQPRCAL
jgi:hypothetical protein